MEELYGITLRQLREEGRDERIQSGRRLISLVAKGVRVQRVKDRGIFMEGSGERHTIPKGEKDL